MMEPQELIHWQQGLGLHQQGTMRCQWARVLPVAYSPLSWVMNLWHQEKGLKHTVIRPKQLDTQRLRWVKLLLHLEMME